MNYLVGMSEPAASSEESAHHVDEIGPEQAADEQHESIRASARRALRELEAAHARVERNAERVYGETRENLVAELLPVLDDVDRTIVRAEAEANAAAIVEGVRLVRRKLERVLERYGVQRIDATDKRFDPSLHDAISVVPVADPERHGAVLEQIQPGYRFGDKLLRPAKVVVGNHAPASDEAAHASH